MALDDKYKETPKEYYHRKHEEHMMNNAGYWDMVPEYGNVIVKSKKPVCLTCGNRKMDDATCGFECKRCLIKRLDKSGQDGQAEYERRIKIVVDYQIAHDNKVKFTTLAKNLAVELKADI